MLLMPGRFRSSCMGDTCRSVGKSIRLVDSVERCKDSLGKWGVYGPLLLPPQLGLATGPLAYFRVHQVSFRYHLRGCGLTFEEFHHQLYPQYQEQPIHWPAFTLAQYRALRGTHHQSAHSHHDALYCPSESASMREG
jgi:hypothetical protein